MNGKEPTKRSYTPFLKEAQEGDAMSERLLRIAIANGIIDISQFQSIGTQGLAKLLDELKIKEGATPLTASELAEQKRMRRWLPQGKKYKKTK